MRKEHHRVSLTVPKINISERVGMKPSPVCSDSFLSHCICAYSSSQTLRLLPSDQVSTQKDTSYTPQEKNSVFPFTVLCTQISWSSFLETVSPCYPIPPKMSGKKYWYFSLRPDTWLIPGASVWWGSRWHFRRKHTRSMLQDESCQPEAQIAQQKKHFTFLKTLFMVSAKTLPWLRAACPVSQGWHTYCTHGLWLTKTL